MNKYKNGSLTHLNLTHGFGSYDDFNRFVKAFWISEKDHEEWYGEPKVAKLMKS